MVVEADAATWRYKRWLGWLTRVAVARVAEVWVVASVVAMKSMVATVFLRRG